MTSIRFSPQFALAVRADGTQRGYKVDLRYTDAEGKSTDLSFVARRRLTAKAEAGVFVCELVRGPLTRVDDHEHIEPDPLAELAARCGEVLNPLQIRLHYAGHALSLLADTALKDRWAVLKPELEDYYKGDAAAAYLTAMDRRINDPSALSAALCETLFFQTFFAPLYQPYGEGGPLEATLYFKMLPAAPSVAFNCTLHVEPALNDGGGVTVTLRGRYADDRSADDLLAGVAFPITAQAARIPVTGEVYLSYALLPGTNALQSVAGYLELYEPGDDEENPQLLSAVDISVVHRPEEDIVNTDPLPLLRSEEAAKKQRWHFF